MNKRVIIAAAIALVVGVGIGSTTAATKTATRVVTKDVEVQVVKEVTPQTCFRFAELAATSEDTLNEALQALVNSNITRASALIDDWSALNDPWFAAKDACLGEA